ncbi:MAG: aminotransferase class V-fold PLP-dependent enzyme [Nitrospirae bacterium]|nr:aminotransferase class V-fold PLP-dependent enzyme [Nitrospirota bacterium]MDA1304079.1 aminotransferase class V-fold PLP-dependent enzyme [Nitrospirota bacterium]
MMLLNPGPVNVSDRVRKALTLPDMCHREAECDELIQNIQQKLLKAFVPGAESEYVAILLTGSGTAAVEASILSSVPIGKRVFVVNNGMYGQRMSDIVASQRLGVPELKFDWDTPADPEKIRTALKHHPEVSTLAIVHHETTVGLVNPVNEIAKIADDLNRVCVVDSVSGLGGEPIEVAGSHMYVVAGTAGKCIQGFPGVSFVLIRKGFIERAVKFPKRSMYLNLANYYVAMEQGRLPYTPAVQVCAAFDEALNELLEEGVDNRIQRYASCAALIRDGLGALGMKMFLPAERQSNSLTTFYLPEGLAYQDLHDRLKERGFIIYAGQGHLSEKIFRVANMGALKQEDFESFVKAFKEIV